MDQDPTTNSNDPQEAIVSVWRGIEELLSLLLVVSMRNYDINLALLNEQNPEAAAKFHQLHEQGKIVGSWPLLDIPPEQDESQQED